MTGISHPFGKVKGVSWCPNKQQWIPVGGGTSAKTTAPKQTKPILPHLPSNKHTFHRFPVKLPVWEVAVSILPRS